MIAAALNTVRERIDAACRMAGRSPDSVDLLAVSKGFPISAIHAAMAAGQREYAESYVQEAAPKIQGLRSEPLSWHFVGPIQSNKTREIAALFDWVHGVDRLKIAERLSQQRLSERGPLNVCVQVNISGESSKSGCSPQAALSLCRDISRLPGMRLRGLMAIPAPAARRTDTRTAFRDLHSLFLDLRAAGLALDTLSAGMSDDLEDAIAEGSTLVRVGTAIFGVRPGR